MKDAKETNSNKFIIDRLERTTCDYANLAGFFLDLLDEVGNLSEENRKFIEEKLERHPLPDNHLKLEEYLKTLKRIGDGNSV